MAVNAERQRANHGSCLRPWPCLVLLLWSLQQASAWSPADLLDIAGQRVGGRERTITEGTASRQLMQCINDAYTPKTVTWESAMSDDLAALSAAEVLWSAKPVLVPITIVTQLSINRLSQLWAQCRGWRGPLSAAVYTAVEQSDMEHLTSRNIMLLRGAIKQVTSLFEMSERDPDACKLDITLVFEQYMERRAMMLYPVNALRNIARLQARTPLVALMDVDILISSQFVPWLWEDDRAEAMVQNCRDKTAYVLPAFNAYGNHTVAVSFADRLALMGKPFLTEGVKRGAAGPFDAKRFPCGHNSTNFTRWYNDSEPYEVKYTYRYEPWVIVDRRIAPWHDVRFRGYGQNKIVHIAHINATGFKFVVHPTAFIVHRPHKHTNARLQLVQDMDNLRKVPASHQTAPLNTIYGKSKHLLEMAKSAMDAGHFEPVVDAQTQNCLSSLPWWA